jgi:chlorite dismutase
MLAFEKAYWALAPDHRAKVLDAFAAELPGLADKVHVYQVFPARSDTDLMLWCTVGADEDLAAADLFGRLARFMSGLRQYVKPVNTLWGFTRPSQYHPGQSTQVLDPSSEERKPYLVVYPFSKTNEWYLMSRDARQGMMNEHIKLGKEYPTINQLLLYSTGLEDQEFVVVYETEELPHFSELVVALRSTDGRRFTLKDMPIYTATWRPLAELLACWK